MPRSRRWGFTLVELVVVVIIISMVAAIAIPRLGGAMVRRRIEAAAQRVGADLDLARRQARLASQSRTVKFDAVQHRYTIEGISDPDRPGEAYVVDLTAEPYRARVLFVRFGLDNELVFDGFGNPDEESDVVLHIGNVTRRVVVTPANPQPRIEALTD
ncbi:MAG TPA: prepilin-type N-terminal cleavage/methylation domain-containing protein [Phycisphaerae bacterium]|nr:prepilin-type N-terminal cleavage/methylation domain-containing protein [Phycisphaerae bacterium]